MACCPNTVVVVPTGGGIADGVVTAGVVSGGNISLTRSVAGLVVFPLGSVDEHSDVDTTSVAPAIGEVLGWDGANWVPTTNGGTDEFVNGGSVTGGNIELTRAIGADVVFALGSIDEHSDVDTTTTAPIDGDVLTWVNANSAWEPLAPSGGGGNATAAVNGTAEAIAAFSTVTYSSFNTAGATVSQSWLTPGTTTQPLTTAGKYIVSFTVIDGTTGADFTVKPTRTIGTATITSHRGVGSWAGEILVDWTGTDVTNGDSIEFVCTNNAGSVQSITLDINITKIE